MKEIEKRSAEEIRVHQEDELQKLLVYLQDRSPFYRGHFLKNNIDISRIKSVADLVKLPVTTKDDLQANNWSFLCVSKNRISEYCTTSGTMGTPVTIALTEKDLERLAYNECLSFTSAGCGPDDVFQLMLSLDRQFMAGIAYHSGIRRIGGGIARVGPGNIQMQLDTIQRLSSTVLIAVPSFIIAMINYAAEHGMNLNATSVRKVICIGENIRNDNLELNALGQQIVKHWSVELYSTYASTEMQTAFTECGKGCGGHHHPELLLFEILDEDNRQLRAGEYGELTITTLGVEGMPLLRYKTGDICAYHEEPCACGRSSARISPVKGRKHQLIKYSGTTLYPQSIFNVLNGIDEIRDFAIQLSKNEIGTDDLLINIAVSEYSKQLDAKIRQSLQSALRVLPKIDYMSVAEIQKMHVVEGKRKPSKLIDNR